MPTTESQIERRLFAENFSCSYEPSPLELFAEKLSEKLGLKLEECKVKFIYQNVDFTSSLTI